MSIIHGAGQRSVAPARGQPSISAATLGKRSGSGASLDAVPRPSPRVLNAIGTVARLGLAAVWIASGAIKLFDPHGTVASVKAYELVPDGLVSLVAAVLPFLELALGLLLLFGVGVRIVAVLSAVLLLVYIAGVAQSWARGLTIDCGCFGGGGEVAAGQTHYPEEILRDTGFLLLAVWLAVRPRTFASVDGWLIGSQPEPTTLENAS
jgi:uncharacterized membrane protein YphA (DoxX/SURF4 family)